MMHLMRDVYTFTDRPCLTEHRVQFTPTVPHCSMATLIGLCSSVMSHYCGPCIYTGFSSHPRSHTAPWPR